MARMTSPARGVVPMDGLRTGHFRHPMESSIAVIFISNIPAQGTCNGDHSPDKCPNKGKA